MSTVIDRLEKLADKAMVRPWRYGLAGYVYDAERVPVLVTEDGEGADVQDDNAEYVVAAVNALPDLLKLARAADVLGRQAHGGSPIEDWFASIAEMRAALEPLFREDPS